MIKQNEPAFQLAGNVSSLLVYVILKIRITFFDGYINENSRH